MNKKTRLSSLVAFVLVLCMLFSFCSVLSSCGDDSEPQGCAHSNTSLKNQKEATCAEEGYTGDMVCNDCTAIVTKGAAIAKLEHTYDEGKVTKDPTCIDTGVLTYTCSACGGTKVDSIPTVPHQDVFHDAQDGNHFHTCQYCPLNEKKEHTPVDDGTAFAATCTEGAYTLYTCAECDGQYKVYDESAPALNHKFGEWVTTESTCLAKGAKTQTCQNPGCTEANTLELPVAPSCNMQFSGYENDKAPDCINGATAIYHCVDCFTESTKEVNATGVHNYVVIDKESDGFVIKECTVCKETISSFDAKNATTADIKADKIDKAQALEMNMKEAAIQFPSDVVGAITGGTDLSVSADVLDAATKNNAVNKVSDAETKAALEKAPVYDFTVKVDNQNYSDKFSTKVAITLDYDNGDADTDGIVIYYLAENGEIEAVTDVIYNAETKQVTFFVEHFSFYAVAYKETQEMRCKRGNHNYVKTNEKVEATCYTFGYTVYECTGCARKTLDDIVERKPHNYGDIIPAIPTCEIGSWSTRICSNPGCFSVLNVQFFGATGHAMDKPATCDSPSTCTKCKKILARPLGHDYTAWEVVVEATEEKTGLRRRNCPICGDIKEEVLAKLGTIEALKYESYSDLLNLYLKEGLDISNGKLEFALDFAENDQRDVIVEIVAEEKDNGYRMSVTVTADGGEKYELYYDNGVFVGGGIASDVDFTSPMSIDTYKEAMEQIYTQLDDYAVAYLKMAKDFISEYKGLFAGAINYMFEKAELEYTADDIDKLVDSVETVYAYLSMRLGYTTSLELKDQTVLPDADDFKAVLDLLMEAEEADGVTTYTLNAAPILEFANEFQKFLEDHADDTLAEFIYFLIGEQLREYDASLTDFNKTVDFIAKKFPGTFTVNDAIDMYISFAEESDFPSIDKLYELINTIASKSGAADFDAKTFAEQFGNKTLDELAKSVIGSEDANIAAIYTQIKQMAASTKVDDYPIEGMTASSAAAMLKETLAQIELKADISISLDADGHIVNVTIDHSFKIKNGDEFVEIESATLKVVRDDTIKVTIPSELLRVMSDVKTSYDAEGNLIIEGLNAENEYTFNISGNGTVGFNDAIVRDATLSAEYGRDIYVLKEEYWNRTQHIEDYIIIDGKYYESDYTGSYEVVDAISTFSLADIKDKITINTDRPIGTLADTDIPVYSMYIAGANYKSLSCIAYEKDGVWMAPLKYGYFIEYSLEDYTEKNTYYVVTDMTLEAFKETFTLGLTREYGESSTDEYLVQYNGKTYPRLTATVKYGSGNDAISFSGFYVGSEFKFLDEYRYLEGHSIYSFDIEVPTLPAHTDSRVYNTTVATRNSNGEIEIISVQEISIWNKLPTYYVKVNNSGVFANFDSSYLCKSFDESNKEALTLPDGNTLYVIGRTSDNEYGYNNGYETAYGYAKTVSNMYIQTAALISQGNIVEVLYRGTSEKVGVNLSSVYDVNDYLTSENGVYKISAELINKLRALCTEEGDSFAINAVATVEINGKAFENGYALHTFVKLPDIDINDISFGASDSDNSFWYRLFGYGTSVGPQYDVVKNADGSISLIFPMNSTVTNVTFPSNVEFPADNIYVKNNELSASTGLDIYTFKGSYTYTCSEDYVYRNGKYYDYSIATNHRYDLVDDLNLSKNWHIGDTYYRFSMIGAEGLPAELPVYETTIRFNYFTYSGYNNSITLYTFILDGVMNVAVEASVTGESLLTFERYMPIDEYMNSLIFEFNDTDYYYSRYVDGRKTTVYHDFVGIYETDASGKKIGESPKCSIGVEYVMQKESKKFIRSYNYLDDIIVIDSTPVQIDNSALSLERYEHIGKFHNGTVTIVSFSWKETEEYTADFVKLAGRMYRYDDSYWYYKLKPYQSEKINEWTFNNKALDKVWYYVVIKVDENGNETRTYYTEFIPSDYGFNPSGEVVNEYDIVGDMYSEVLLGYTSEGDELCEVAYFIEPDYSVEWTEEVQSDGTVFLHKDGTGYLKVTENSGNYYVKARKVEMADGTTQIYCFLRSGRLTGSEINQYTDSFFNGYITAKDNKLNITKEFLEVAKSNNRNEFHLSVNFNINDDSYSTWETIDYYELESYFLIK